MLFKRRVSFRDALHVRRRVYDEMAARNAPTNVQHGAQSQSQPEAVSLKTPLPRVFNPVLPPTHTSLRPIDCRWKRGRPMPLSSRVFSTEPANHTPRASGTASTPAIAVVAGQSYHQDAQALSSKSREQYEQVGNVATTDQQRISAGLATHTVQHDDVHVHTDCVADGYLSSKEALALKTAVSSSTGIECSDVDMQHGAPSTIAHSIVRSSSGDGAMEHISDTNYVPISNDQGERNTEQDGPEAEGVDEKPVETHTPLRFQIPEDVLQAAMTAPENSKASFWSNTLYRGLNNSQVLVHYCRTKEVAERVAKHFVNETVVGFDIEWKPYSSPESIKKNVCLIQLACEDRIALFHMSLFQGSTAAQLMPPTLRAILESPDIYKVGVAIKGDSSRVNKFLKVEPQGVFELSRLHNLVEHYATNPGKVNNKLISLASQVQQHLQLPLFKGGHLIDDPEDLYNVRSSDWSLPLNNQQIHYAAADAYAGFRIFDILEEKRKQLKPTPPRPLVCDYDSKPKPRSSISKPRKKRTIVAKDEETAHTAAEQSVGTAEQIEEPEEEVEETSEMSPDTDGYETAQEDLLDSHQLEGEEPVALDGIYKPTHESEYMASRDPGALLKTEETAAATDASQRRIGRIDLGSLRGLDPGYPKLPNFRSTEDAQPSADNNLINLFDRLDKVNVASKMAELGILLEDEDPDAETDEETDEFDDSELEEALQDLKIGSHGLLQEIASEPVANGPNKLSKHSDLIAEDNNQPGTKQPSNETDVKAGLATTTEGPTFEEEEQQLIDLIKDPEVAKCLHTPPAAASAPAAPVSAPQASCSKFSHPPPLATTGYTSKQTDPSTTPEYALATTWARTYLASTIPPPGSLTPSHIRATVPHLRAYHMWHHQHLILSDIGAQLRNPPLAESTVGSYVLQAITLERMEYDASAVRAVLMRMPEALRRGKWRGLAEKIGAR